MQLSLPLSAPLPAVASELSTFTPASSVVAHGFSNLPAAVAHGFSPASQHARSVTAFDGSLHDLSIQLVRHPRARRYVLRVSPDGAIHVTMPRWASKRGALEFAASERAWIEKEWRRVAAERATAVSFRRTAEEIRALRARARQELTSRLLTLAEAHGLAVSRVSIRNQKWRWGSCSRDGHICLNWRLVLMPVSVREYVMIHELMHLRRMDHSPRFWKLVAAACPDYQAARRWLRANGHALGG